MSELLEDRFRSEIDRFLRFTPPFDSVDDDFDCNIVIFARKYLISRIASYIE